MIRRTLAQIFTLALAMLCATTAANSSVAVSPLFGNNMVVQRDKPLPVYGTATPAENISVTFNGQFRSTTADALGNWQVLLPPMAAKNTGGNMVITGTNSITITNVLIGDVWLCSGQSNMDFTLDQCNRQADKDSANFPGIRYFAVPVVQAAEPTKSFAGNWQICSPSTAGGFSGVAFYFARKIYQSQSANIPIGIIKSSQGGTNIDHWLAPEGSSDIPTLQPLYSQPIVQWGPFCLFNAMIYPLAPYGIRGVLWYQGEYGEKTNQSPDSYYLKERALIQGWRRLWGGDEFPLYLVQIANLDAAPTSATPETGGWPLIREFQKDAMALSHTGMASALDVGDANDIHPADKLDVGERLALWALKNEYGQSSIVPSGPILKDVTASGNKLICTFDYVGSGLMVGSKTLYQPTQEVIGGTLQRFSIAGSNGVWYSATATIVGDTVELSSPSVTAPRKAAYAYWKNPTGANLYNHDGLPASPFYVDDVTLRYAVTATAGTGGTISPAGAKSYLKRMTALYTITPDPGNYIQDVKIDGVSVGSVNYYTFDPLYANHTIAATFASTPPSYTINASSGAGGSVSPSGTLSVTQGSSSSFNIAPVAGSHLASVTVDGAPVGRRPTFTFGDIRTNHTLSATFACTIVATATYGGAISPSGATEVNYGTNRTITIAPIPGFTIADVKVDGVSVGAVPSYTFTNVTADHTISASFIGGGSGSVPQTSQLILSCLASTLPASGNTGNWATYLPSGKTLTTMGSPTVETINGRKWERNIYNDNDGYVFGSTYSSAIPCTGASIVVAARPIRSGDMGNWRSIVDVFYDRLVFGVTNDAGQVNVRRNGSLDYSTTTIPDGQITILSLVVQSDGTYKVWANGTQIMTNTNTSAMTSLNPLWNGNATGFWSYINVGHNNPDGWTTFNGNIGDVFLYKTALTDTDRQQLERYIANKLTDYTITASAGPGGSISPSGSVTVMGGAAQTFTVTPSSGYVVGAVTVDGVSQGAVSSYTFSAVSANHTISATFTPIIPTASIADLKAKADGTPVRLTGTQTVIYAPVDSGNARTTTFFYIGETKALGGLRVVDKTTDTLSLGNQVTNLTGYVRKPAGGEVYLELTATPAGSGSTPIRPVGLHNRAVLTDPKSPTNTVVVWGKVKTVNNNTWFDMSDGYSTDLRVNVNGVRLPDGFGSTKTAVVSGVLSADKVIQAQTIYTLP